MAYTIGLDYGTNSVRCLIVDVTNGDEVGSNVYEYETGEAGIILDPADYQRIVGLTYATATPEQKRERRESWSAIDVLITVVVLGLVLGLYLYFSFWLR